MWEQGTFKGSSTNMVEITVLATRVLEKNMDMNPRSAYSIIHIFADT